MTDNRLKSNDMINNPEFTSEAIRQEAKEIGRVGPRLIAWELTRGCNLKCVHCRATAADMRDPRELSTDECMKLIDDVAREFNPIMILTGGEPLVREDIYEIAQSCIEKKLRTVMAPNGTLVTPEVAARLVEIGISRISLSVDAPNAEIHDGFRGVPGAFDSVMKAMDNANEVRLPFQINMTVTRRNAAYLPEVLDLAIRKGAVLLDVFLLVPTGRGEDLMQEELSPEEYERVLEWMAEKQETSPVPLKATCAPHYQRIIRQTGHYKKSPGHMPPGHPAGHAHPGSSPGGVPGGHLGGAPALNAKPVDRPKAQSRGCLAGTGFAFVSHIGEVYPCGYFPVVAGNMREHSFPEIWKHSRLFNELRDVDALKGKCGPCEFRYVCNGCRARALAIHGDYMSEEPHCSYIPRGYEKV